MSAGTGRASRRKHRPAVEGLAAAGIAALLAACSGGGQTNNGHAPAPAALQVHSADQFVDSVGINVHLGYADTPYRNTKAVLDRLNQLGVRHVRDSLPLKPSHLLLGALRQLPAHGIKADLAIGQTAGTVTTLPSPSDVLKSLQHDGLRDAVDGVEMPNEWDLRGNSQWVTQISTFTKEFGALVRADPIWSDVPLVGPSTGRVYRVSQLTNLSSYIDVSNLHDYTAGGPPEKDLHYLAEARKVAPGKPLWVTEMGFHTAVNQDGKQPAVTEAQQGSYLARQLLEDYAHGAARSYVYELLEQKPDPGQTNQERHFGLLRMDLSPKPAFNQLRTLLNQAGGQLDPSARQQTPLPPQISATLQTPGDPVDSLLLRRKDGSYRLVVWARGGLQFDGVSQEKNARITLEIKGAPRVVRVVRTAAGTVAGQSQGVANKVTGRLGGDPIVLDIAATAAPTSTPSGAAQTRPSNQSRTMSFDSSSIAKGAAEVPHGKIGQLPEKVRLALVWGISLALAAVLVVLLLVRRKRRTRPAKK